jgi:RNA polymerase sigma factor (TIGR02999 family)
MARCATQAPRLRVDKVAMPPSRSDNSPPDLPEQHVSNDELFAALYAELHRLAELRLRNSGSLTLGATTLVHEAYLRMLGRDPSQFPDRAHFFSYASRVMRSLVIDHARKRLAQKRRRHLSETLSDNELPAEHDPEVDSLTNLSDALRRLSELDASLSELVDLHFFAGCSFGEIAALREVSERTVQRDWQKARMLLRRALGADLAVLSGLQLPV